MRPPFYLRHLCLTRLAGVYCIAQSIVSLRQVSWCQKEFSVVSVHHEVCLCVCSHVTSARSVGTRPSPRMVPACPATSPAADKPSTSPGESFSRSISSPSKKVEYGFYPKLFGNIPPNIFMLTLKNLLVSSLSKSCERVIA